MFKWMKETVGISEPNYGPEAIQTVGKHQTKERAYTELSKDDFRWEIIDSTCVETKTFYMLSDDGKIGLAQVIYSNVMGIQKTAQFSSKITYPDPATPNLFCTDNLKNFTISDDKQDFTAEGVSMKISDDGKSYHINSSLNKKSVVDLTFTQSVPAMACGENGTTYFGTDPAKPWGKMYHKFWPLCKVEGQFLTPQGPVDFKGRGIFIHCLQGMKPHFAAAKWNFCNFQSPFYSAISMSYTTPPSYGPTTVSLGVIVSKANEDKPQILFASASDSASAPCTVEHTAVKGDPENDWPEPSAIKFTWGGKTAEGQQASAVLEGELGERTDRVDVMAEVPKFVKQIVAGAAGTKPYIYQYVPKMTLKLDVGGEKVKEEGQAFIEATFIS